MNAPYFVPCTHCGTTQRLQFYRLRWVKVQLKTAAYHSTDCERPISNGPAAVAAARLPSTASAVGLLWLVDAD